MKPSALLTTIFLMTALACGGTANSGITEINVRVTGLPQFICPSSTPRPTHTPLPTLTQPATATQVAIATPMVYATYAPYCNYAATPAYRSACPGDACVSGTIPMCQMLFLPPLAIPNPPGAWSGGGIGYGPTATPRPTYTPHPTRTPYPTPTPYIVTENYAMGADVYIDGGNNGLKLRFRVGNPRVVTTTSRQVAIWDIEIGNTGSLVYNALPGAQVFVSQLRINGQLQNGNWYASAEAIRAAGLTVSPQALDIAAVQPGETLVLTLAAFTPSGEVAGIGWVLDPYSGGVGNGVVGGNTAIWLNATDPSGCTGNIGSGASIPTPSRLRATPTPSVTPYIPPYSGYGSGRR
jgi:hypothetical protein